MQISRAFYSSLPLLFSLFTLVICNLGIPGYLLIFQASVFIPAILNLSLLFQGRKANTVAEDSLFYTYFIGSCLISQILKVFN